MARLKTEAIVHLDIAEAICTANANQTRAVAHETEPTRHMLRDAVFYSAVSSDEMKAAVAAMSQEFRGTGHWYFCFNGHPLTVGECEMPMETSRCPQCGETVGGRHHEAAEGVTHANDIEEQFGRMRV